MPDPERVYGLERFGPVTRVAIVVLSLNAILFLILGAVFGEPWAFIVAAPSALLVLMFIGSAFAGPDIDEE